MSEASDDARSGDGEYSKPKLFSHESHDNAFVRRLIPSITAVSLTLGACGDTGSGGDGRDGASSQPTMKSAISDYCDKRKECHPSAFSAEFESLDECTSAMSDFFDETVELEVDGEGVDYSCFEESARCLLDDLECVDDPYDNTAFPGFYMYGVQTTNQCGGESSALARCEDDSDVTF